MEWLISAANASGPLSDRVLVELNKLPLAGSKPDEMLRTVELIRARLLADVAPELLVKAPTVNRKARPSIEFSGDSKRAFGLGCVVDLDTGALDKQFRATDSHLGFNGPDTEVVIAYLRGKNGRTEEGISLRNWHTGAEACSFLLPKDTSGTMQITGVAGTVSGRLVAISGPGGTTEDLRKAYPVYLVDAANGKLAHILTGQVAPVKSLQFTRDAQLLVSPGLVWNVATGNVAYTFSTSGWFSATSLGIATVARDGMLTLLDPHDGKALMKVQPPKGQVIGLTAGGCALIAIPVLDDRSQTPLFAMELFNPWVPQRSHHLPGLFKQGAVAPDGDRLVFLSDEDELAVYATKAPGTDWSGRAYAVCQQILTDGARVPSDASASEAVALKSAANGVGDIENDTRQAHLRKEAKKRAEDLALAQAEAAARSKDKASPAGIALLNGLVQSGTIKSFQFVGSFKPFAAERLERGEHFNFSFVTEAGLLREHVGYIIYHGQMDTDFNGQPSTKWTPMVLNIDGQHDQTLSNSN